MSQRQLKKELIRLIKKEAFFKQKVVLASGRTSNFYIDIRRISLTSKGAFLIANLLWEKLKDEKFDAVGGLTLGADPILSALAYHAHTKGKSLNTFIIRKTPKKHGQNRLIEGPILKKGSSVILVDDVATSGGSLVDSIKKLKSLKLKVVKAFVVVDRREGATRRIARFKCPLGSLLTLNDLTRFR